MKNVLLLLLSANRVHAMVMSGGRVSDERKFSDTTEGKREFSAFLEDCRHPTYLLVDLIEEDFRQESVPHLIGRSRRALLQRKFEQFYRGTPFRQATLLQRQKGGRRDDDMLFSALTNPALITPWLNILLERKIPLTGIYSVPQISAPLIKDHPSDYLLLISWEESAGLRQTFFSKHRLQISRLTPSHAGLGFHDTVRAELPRTYQYLKSLSLLPEGQTLDVRLLGCQTDLTSLQSVLPASTDMRYDLVDLSRLALKLGMDTRFDDSDASPIFLHYLARHTPATHYGNAVHVRYCTLWKIRRALNLAAGTLLLGSLLFGGLAIWQGNRSAERIRAMDAEAQRLQVETARIAASFPAAQVSASDMKAAVSIQRELDRRTQMPVDVLRPVANALDRFPQIELDELGWTHKPDGQASTGTGPAPQTMTLKGRLVGFESHYREALDTLGRFRQELEKQGYRVVTTSEPLDLGPGGRLSDRRDSMVDRLEFSLQLLRNPPT